jgi:hypothetical protein
MTFEQAKDLVTKGQYTISDSFYVGGSLFHVIKVNGFYWEFSNEELPE